jgi:phosphoribosyl 1,2-cyclic phosphodiesterase
MTEQMRLRFWGVRGSLAVPGPATAVYGGNTACVQLEGACSDVILFDAGTGIRAAGQHLLACSSEPQRIHLFLTHFHWDHIQGLPFFGLLFNPANHVTIYSSRFTAPLEAALRGLMAPPYFSISFDEFKARVELVEMKDSIQVGSVRIRPIEVHHPQGACAYQVDRGDLRFLYAPDREHGDPRLDAVLLDAARGATALIVDSQYTPEEYGAHRGWGHSTWAESVKLAQEAQATTLVLFHHDSTHTDDVVHRIEEHARREFPDTFAAKEGWAFEL